MVNSVTNNIQRNGYVSAQVRRFNDYHKKTDEKLYSDWVYIVNAKKNLLTNVGRDAFHTLCYINDDSVVPSRGFGCIALTQTSITPAVSDTILSGEIVVSGLSRADALTKTHSSASSVSTVEHTFTAGAAFATVRGTGLFNSMSGGVLSHIATFTSVALATFDQLRITFTLNLA